MKHFLRHGSLIALIVLALHGVNLSAAQSDSRPYYLGVDLSYVNEMEDCDGEYRIDGELTDPFEIFSHYGANLVRVRLWHTPTWTDYSTLEDVQKTIARAKDQGMAVLLDFHYSDTWADPDHQTIPAAWADIIDEDALAQALYDYTFETLFILDQQGLMPDMVQVGNEINSEILRGENEAGVPIHWDRNAALINAGIRAVRDAGAQAATPPQVMLHIAQPENIEGWLRSATKAGVTDFDIIGMSYYTGWSDYSVEGVGSMVSTLRYRFGKEVLIAEAAYPWTLDGVRESAGNIPGQDFLLPDYPATPAGQKQFMVDLTQSVLANGGLGVVYWEPAWISTRCSTQWGQGSHWENATVFDFNDQNNVHEGIEFLSAEYKLPVELTFQVTLNEAAPEGAFFWGDFTGSGKRLLPMVQVDQQMYRFAARLMPGQTVSYAFYSGPNRADNVDTCAVRSADVPAFDATITHTFGDCDPVISDVN